METSKIKNLMIYILLFVNLFLIGLLAADWLQTRSAERTSMEAVETILSENGITLSAGRIPGEAVKGYFVSRDMEKEERVVTALVGRILLRENQNGNIMYYKGEHGAGKFRGTGDFDVLLDDDMVPISGSTVETAQSLLRKMGLDGTFSPELSTLTGGVYTTVVMVCEYEGLPVVNGQVKFDFASDSLKLISGTRLLDVQREDPAVMTLDPATLLTRFVGIISRNGYVCNELREISPVYLYAPDVSGGKLSPLWRIETDTSVFYLNMSTGQEEPVTWMTRND